MIKKLTLIITLPFVLAACTSTGVLVDKDWKKSKKDKVEHVAPIPPPRPVKRPTPCFKGTTIPECEGRVKY